MPESDGVDWFAPARRTLAALRRGPDRRLAEFITADVPAVVGRAPGRLDVMGGIADYSGSVVLELPLARATFAILQPHPGGRVEVVSLRSGGARRFAAEWDEITTGWLSVPGALAAHARAAGEGWAAYVLGVVQLCAGLVAPDAADGGAGLRLLIHSDVPEGSGVSSSAALEVATMAAVGAHLGLRLEGAEIAAGCQWVENHVVGAPCGIMDQLTAVLGRADRLLRIRCQPAAVEGYLDIPPQYRFYGIDSGVRHAVSGADYATVRAAAFMGYRIVAEAAGLPASAVEGRTVVEDSRWQGYLANLTLPELQSYQGLLPERMRGEEFLRRFRGHVDAVTTVDPDREYPVRAATRHPVLENARVERFAALLGDLPRGEAVAVEMGKLMLASHESYSACGLGSSATDRIVELVHRAGPDAGLYGAKITGGGSGGTVAVLGRRDAEGAVRAIAAEMGTEPFLESGPGMAVRTLTPPSATPP